MWRTASGSSAWSTSTGPALATVRVRCHARTCTISRWLLHEPGIMIDSSWMKSCMICNSSYNIARFVSFLMAVKTDGWYARIANASLSADRMAEARALLHRLQTVGRIVSSLPTAPATRKWGDSEKALFQDLLRTQVQVTHQTSSAGSL